MKARVLVGLQFGILGLLVLAKGPSLMESNSWIEKISPVFYLIGGIIFFFAYIALRPSLRVSPIPREGAPLIMTGIYRWLRHPMYVSVLIFAAGLAFRNLSYLNIGLWFLLLIVLVIKGAYEDSLLALVHADAPEYQRSTRGIFLSKKHEKRKR